MANFILRLFASVIRYVLLAIDRFQARAFKRSKFLEGNFAPVHDELYVDKLSSEGTIPEELDGEFVRNGPNPAHEPKGFYHWFDGDGMLHGVHFKRGEATYTNRWVRTARFKAEATFGYGYFPRLGDLIALGKLTSSWQAAVSGLRMLRYAFYSAVGLKWDDYGTANTSIEFHDGRLLALVESSAPHHVHLPELDTVGRYTYDKALKHPFTAHPKVDATTGEMFFFGYRVQRAPYLSYSVVSADGKLQSTADITLPGGRMMHDFAMTEEHVIFMDLPYVFDMQRARKFKNATYFDDSLPARFGVLPRYDSDETRIQWFTAETCYVFHTANAWEDRETGEVVLVACRSDGLDLDALDTRSDSKREEEKHTDATGNSTYLHEWRFNLATGKTTERRLCDLPTEFPRLPDRFLGRPARFVYSALLSQTREGLMDGIMKTDLPAMAHVDTPVTEGSKAITVMRYGVGQFGGEPVFVARADAVEEDDGWLLTFVYDETRNRSQLWIIDAAAMEVTCKVNMPRRIPYGFHGKWVTGRQIEEQREE